MGNQNEIWKDIDGYEGLYQISDKRRIKSLDYRRTGEERVLKTRKNEKGYLHVILYKDRKPKSYRVHRLVAQNFIPNPENYPEVNHIDEDKTNNAVNNLEWCDRSYNVNYRHGTEKSAKSKNKPVICLETGEIFSSGIEAQEKTGIFSTSITRCAKHRKRHHTAGRCHWEYIEKEE